MMFPTFSHTMRRDVDRAIDGVARRQHGAFNLAQVVRAGGDRELARRRVASERWSRVDAGVFVLPSHERTWEQRAMAATLGHPMALLSGRPGAALWGLEGVGKGRLQVTVPRSTHHRSTIARVRRSDVVARRVVDRIPVNSVPLVLIELAGGGIADPDHMLELAIVQNLTDADLLRDAHLRWAWRGVPGTAALRRFLEGRVDGDPIPESVLELAGRDLLAHPGIPPFEPQAAFPWAPSGRHRVDFLIRAWRMIVECDGRLWHTRLQQMDDDNRRDLAAATHGYLTVRLGHATITRERGQCRADLLAAGALRSTPATPSGLWLPDHRSPVVSHTSRVP